MKKLRQFIFNGLLVTAVSLLLRTVGVGFNIYLSNKIGPVAMGLFTLISTVYGFAITLATSGIGLASTRLIAEALGQEPDNERHEKSPAVCCTVRKCLAYALSFSLGAAILLFVLASPIGRFGLDDERTVVPLRLLSFTLPFISAATVLNGYFTAVRRVHKTAPIQIVGQAIKIYGCIFFLGLFQSQNTEGACIAVALGGLLAESASCLIQAFFYCLEKKKNTHLVLSDSQKKAYQTNLLKTALPVAFSAYVRSGLITVEHILIPKGLEKSGASRNLSLAAYGIIHSMVFPLIMFPSALSASFASLLVPEVAEAKAAQNFWKIERMIAHVLRAVLVFSIGSAGVMILFAFPLSDVIYPNTDSGKYILMIAPLIPIMYSDTSVDALLKGMGEQFYCMIVNIIDSLLSVILVWFLLPRMGIVGYIVTVYFTEIVNATLSVTRLFCVAKIKIRWREWLIDPLLGIVFATSATALLLRALDISVTSVSCLCVQLVLCVALYLFFSAILHMLPSAFCQKKKSTVLRGCNPVGQKGKI